MNKSEEQKARTRRQRAARLSNQIVSGKRSVAEEPVRDIDEKVTISNTRAQEAREIGLK